ncbi:hypothetical protein EV663_101694 [Rhodovulum bhavnagarense]|uniref:Uncharacterized protein n=1 Tax=Rhodovulum bhavnagarense TaxID=992286 RepID=A0A4R2RWC0_9RHOB|nr:hypothetical protein [Rhodovulum bhavnagarense]TCP63425.1 hypothetical protein EV663_101694 [Rhodovulum bhavnagarense]
MSNDLEKGTASDAGPEGLPSRRSRLDALKARRDAVGEETAPLAAPVAGARVGSPRPQGRRGRMMGAGAAGGGRGAVKLKILTMVHKILTQTPEDERGLVEGTSFTVSGVERLMTLLRERAASEGKPGAKAASGALRFLAADEADPDAVMGASRTRLREMAQKAEAIRGRRGGARGGV